MRLRRFTAALMVAALACAVGAPLAAADDPPVTVPTPTTPAPPPDPAPPPQPKPKPPTHHTTPHHSAPPSRPVTHAPAPVQQTYTPPAATPTHVSHVRTHRAVRHAKVAKKRVVHKPKQTRPVVKPAPKPKTTPAAATKSPRGGATLAASATRTEDSDWLRWFLLLVAATGLMAVSIATVVGNRRVAVPVRRRRPPVRDVIAELVAAPPLLKAPARRAPSRPAPPPAAPEVKAEEPLPVAPPPPPPPPPAPEPEAAAPAAAEPVAAPTEEFCEILVWRGYAKARFYARLELGGGEGDEFAVAESPSFRFRGNGTPDNTSAAQAAHAALVNRLIAKGWEPEETTGPWYAVRFRRPLPSAEHS